MDIFSAIWLTHKSPLQLQQLWSETALSRVSWKLLNNDEYQQFLNPIAKLLLEKYTGNLSQRQANFPN